MKGSPGVFVFKNRKTPDNAAVHQIMITYYDGQYELFSNVVSHLYTIFYSLEIPMIGIPLKRTPLELFLVLNK